MGQFKPMVKMETTEPSVELKLKKGGCVTSAKKMMNGGVMGALSQAPAPGARGGMAPVARPGKPSMMDRRKAMMGKPAMAKGGESKAAHKAEMSKMNGLEKELKSHESKPASKGHKGLATGGVVMGNAGGFKKGGKVKNYAFGGGVQTSDVVTARPDHSPAVTGGVKLGNAGGFKKGGKIGKYAFGGGVQTSDVVTSKPGVTGTTTGGVTKGNAGGFKKGGATKKHYATGGAVNNSGHAVAMPQKPPSKPVSNNRQSGAFKKGGTVKMREGGASQKALEKAYNESIGPDKDDMDMAKAIRDIPGKLFRGAKRLVGMDDKPKAGAVTETEKSVTVEPAKKRGGSVKC